MTQKIFLVLVLSLFLSACSKKIENLITPATPTPQKSGVTIIPVDTNLAQATLVDLTTKTKINFSAPVLVDDGYTITASNSADLKTKVDAYFKEFEFTKIGSDRYTQDDLTCSVAIANDLVVTCQTK